jgi:hypothetical protein
MKMWLPIGARMLAVLGICRRASDCDMGCSMAGHGVVLAAFILQFEPPTPTNMPGDLNVHLERCRHAREGLG